VLCRELLATEEDERYIARTCRRIEVARELERDCEPALHVACTQSVDEAVVDPAGEVVLRGHGVVVRSEDDEREPEPSLGREQKGLVAGELGAKPRRNELQEPLANCVLAAAL